MSSIQQNFQEASVPVAAPAHALFQELAAHAVGRLSCTPADRRRLEQWVRTATAPHRLVLRSRIVLLLLDSQNQAHTARALGISRETVTRWARRFAAHGADALGRDLPGRGRPRGRNAVHVSRVLAALRAPTDGAWTVRRLAAHVGISPASVQRIWRELAEDQRLLRGQLMSRSAAPAGDGGGKPLALDSTDSVGPFPSRQDPETCR